MTDEEKTLAGDYYDNCSTEELRGFIDNEHELMRLNRWKRSEMTQATLNRILNMAIQMRVKDYEP